MKRGSRVDSEYPEPKYTLEGILAMALYVAGADGKDTSIVVDKISKFVKEHFPYFEAQFPDSEIGQYAEMKRSWIRPCLRGDKRRVQGVRNPLCFARGPNQGRLTTYFYDTNAVQSNPTFTRVIRL